MNMNGFTVIAIVVSFLLSVGICPRIIPALQKLKFGQFVRDDGPESHLKKAGTPTMGGIIILASVLITAGALLNRAPDLFPVLIMTIGFGGIGFIDDYLKVVKKRSTGLYAWQKLAMQFVITAVFIFCIFEFCGMDTIVGIPFTDISFDMPIWLYICFLFFVVLGTVNGVNFTDGLDGLATSVTIIVALFFVLAASVINPDLMIISGAVAGSLMGFLFYNAHPARIFMGDTGSLGLGGFVAATAIMLHMPLLIVIIGFVYLMEVISVILQVGYFKLSHGKRIFKMAPIHHHFELCGASETQIVSAFSVITLLLCIVGLLAL